MRTVLACLIALLLLAPPARAQSQADRQAIQSVITQQIEAFRHDDGAAAFGFASPGVRSIFRDEERFMAMVRQGYQPVYRPRATTFGSLMPEGEHLVQRVEVIGPDGQAYLALYYMIKMPNGEWRVDGCDLTESESVGA